MKSWLPRMIMRLRSWLIELANALLPPQIVILESAFGMARTRLLDVAAQLDIATHLEARPEGMTARELAGLLKVHADALHRVLRALASTGVFALDSRGRFRNNRVSRALIPGRARSMHAFVRYFASPSNTRAWSELASTVATGKNAFEKTHGQGIWDYLAAHPDEECLFGAAMHGLTEMDAPFIATGYDFSRFKSICDVAGGSGTLVSSILARYPALEAVILDSARALVMREEPRIKRVTGSFFDSVPPGADAYLLKDILHDWDDIRSLQILKNCRRAMNEGATLLVVEMLLESNETNPAATTADVHMLTVCNEGRQRSREEMSHLLKSAGFSLARVVQLPTPYSILEALAK